MGTQGGGTGVHTGKMGGTQIGCGGGGQIGTEAFGGGHVPLTRNLLKEHHHQDFSSAPGVHCGGQQPGGGQHPGGGHGPQVGLQIGKQGFGKGS